MSTRVVSSVEKETGEKWGLKMHTHSVSVSYKDVASAEDVCDLKSDIDILQNKIGKIDDELRRAFRYCDSVSGEINFVLEKTGERLNELAALIADKGVLSDAFREVVAEHLKKIEKEAAKLQKQVELSVTNADKAAGCLTECEAVSRAVDSAGKKSLQMIQTVVSEFQKAVVADVAELQKQVELSGANADKAAGCLTECEAVSRAVAAAGEEHCRKIQEDSVRAIQTEMAKYSEQMAGIPECEGKLNSLIDKLDKITGKFHEENNKILRDLSDCRWQLGSLEKTYGEFARRNEKLLELLQFIAWNRNSFFLRLKWLLLGR